MCLVGEDATTPHLCDWVERVSKDKNVDLAVVTWSGHGALVPQTPLTAALHPEPDGYDEVWVLHDRFLFDDEIFGLVAHFTPPARVVFIADCCHSGSSYRLGPWYSREEAEVREGRITARVLDEDVALGIVAKNSEEYDAVLRRLVAAPVTVEFAGLSACLDQERAYEANGQGVFTKAVLRLLASGSTRSYRGLVEESAKCTPYQHPRIYWYDDRSGFLNQPAFL